MHVGQLRREPPGGGHPAEHGHLQVHQHDVGPSLARELDGLLAVGGLADDVDADVLEQHPQALAEDRVVVGDDDPQPSRSSTTLRGTGRAGTRPLPSGSRAVTRVPCSGLAPISSEPPTSAARSRMEASPTPATRSARAARTRRRRPSRATHRGGDGQARAPRRSVPPACRTALVSDFLGDPEGSDLDGGRQAVRRARCRSRSIGRPPSPSGRPSASQGTDEPEVVQRRRSQTVDQATYVGDGLLGLARGRGHQRPSRARRHPGASAAAAVSRHITTPDICGPSPSWRSRRSRRRSSSRAVTRRSRDSSRSPDIRRANAALASGPVTDRRARAGRHGRAGRCRCAGDASRRADALAVQVEVQGEQLASRACSPSSAERRHDVAGPSAGTSDGDVGQLERGRDQSRRPPARRVARTRQADADGVVELREEGRRVAALAVEQPVDAPWTADPWPGGRAGRRRTLPRRRPYPRWTPRARRSSRRGPGTRAAAPPRSSPATSARLTMQVHVVEPVAVGGESARPAGTQQNG